LLTSVEEQKNNSKVWVYPNPVTDKSNIYFPNTGQMEVIIETTDSAGKIVESAETCENYMILDQIKYSKGIYFYRVYSREGLIGTGKFLKR
jgi:hypothetical protein